MVQISIGKDKNQHALFLGLLGNELDLQRRENHKALNVYAWKMCVLNKFKASNSN